jgi:hypothetical protein
VLSGLRAKRKPAQQCSTRPLCEFSGFIVAR